MAEPAADPGDGPPGDGREPGGDPGTGPAYRPGHRQEGWGLRFDWGAEGLAAIADGAAAVVVVDVLRFTSAVSVAVGRGALVLPFPWGRGDAARAYAAAHGAELAGRREHGAWSLSPTDLAGLPPGTRLVLPSPNGSALAFAARDGVPHALVLAGCLRNAAAVAAVAAFDAARADLGGWLARSGSGRELASIGFDDDVTAAAILDAEAVAPVLDGPAFSAVAAVAAGHLR